jgi:SAM-dependent methyltransferase
VSWQQDFLDRFYLRSPGWVDGTTEFHQLCARMISPGARILEVGPGPSNPTSRFLATIGELHGIDIDRAVRSNEWLSSASVLEGEVYPFEDEHFDACVSDYVLEHVESPTGHLAEVKRVLRRGGRYVFRTPNVFHYTALVARLTPHWFHGAVSNRLRGLPADSRAPYPTYYRMSSEAAVRRCAAAAGLNVEKLRLVEKEPSYGMQARCLFFALMAYERVVNSSEVVAQLRANIFGVLRK